MRELYPVKTGLSGVWLIVVLTAVAATFFVAGVGFERLSASKKGSSKSTSQADNTQATILKSQSYSNDVVDDFNEKTREELMKVLKETSDGKMAERIAAELSILRKNSYGIYESSTVLDNGTLQLIQALVRKANHKEALLLLPLIRKGDDGVNHVRMARFLEAQERSGCGVADLDAEDKLQRESEAPAHK